jgi:hypothetical protein
VKGVKRYRHCIISLLPIVHREKGNKGMIIVLIKGKFYSMCDAQVWRKTPQLINPSAPLPNLYKKDMYSGQLQHLHGVRGYGHR